MDANVFQIISIIAFVLSAACFVGAVVLFFKFDIRSVIGFLTGKTASKQIEEIREQSQNAGSKKSSPNALELEMQKSGRISQKLTTSDKQVVIPTADISDVTEVLSEELEGSEATQVLSEELEGSEATQVLSEELEGSEATQVLSEELEGSEATQVLSEDSDSLEIMKVIRSEMLINTTEVI